MDIDKFIKSIERLASAKVIVILLIVGLGSFFVYKNIDFITEITFKIDQSKTKESEGKKEDKKIKKGEKIR